MKKTNNGFKIVLTASAVEMSDFYNNQFFAFMGGFSHQCKCGTSLREVNGFWSIASAFVISIRDSLDAFRSSRHQAGSSRVILAGNDCAAGQCVTHKTADGFGIHFRGGEAIRMIEFHVGHQGNFGFDA